jgi:hypothetical protein
MGCVECTLATRPIFVTLGEAAAPPLVRPAPKLSRLGRCGTLWFGESRTRAARLAFRPFVGSVNLSENGRRFRREFGKRQRLMTPFH